MKCTRHLRLILLSGFVVAASLAAAQSLTADDSAKMVRQIISRIGKAAPELKFSVRKQTGSWVHMGTGLVASVRPDGMIVSLEYTNLLRLAATEQAKVSDLLSNDQLWQKAEAVFNRFELSSHQRLSLYRKDSLGIAHCIFAPKPFGYENRFGDSLDLMLSLKTGEVVALLWRKGCEYEKPDIKVSVDEANRRALNEVKGVATISSTRLIYYPKVREQGYKKLVLSYEVSIKGGIAVRIDCSTGATLSVMVPAGKRSSKK